MDALQLFVDYYTRKYRPKRDVVVPDSVPPQGGAAATIHSLASFIPLPYMNPANIMSLGGATTVKDAATSTPPVQASDDEPAITYEKPRPRTAFSSFVDHPDEFILFLEACLDGDGVGEEDKVDLYTTLFEMYLHKANGSQSEEREGWETKAKRLIESGDVCCHAHFWRSVTLDTDKLNRFRSIPPMSFCYRICRTFEVGPFSFARKKVSCLTSSDHTPRPMTRSEPSKH